MTYGSICSGIEAATVAWHPLGWRPAWFAEIDKFPSAVLAHHYPGVPNFGDFTRIQPGDAGSIDLLVGGTPCQSFSVAGKRLGLDDPRGNLTLEWLRLVQRLLPRWVVWENVPGVLSDDGGRTFGTILGALGKLGYRVAWRVLDAFSFGCSPRERLFLVAHSDWKRAGAVLLEPEALQGPHEASHRQGAFTITASFGSGTESTFDSIAAIGRLMQPVEIERALGFPDNYTLVPYRGKPAADGPRYKALGNSMAVPVMRWIGERIAFVDALKEAA